MTLNAKIGGFMDFFNDFRLRQVCIVHKEAPQYYVICTLVWL